MTESQSQTEGDTCPKCGSGLWATWGKESKNCLRCGHSTENMPETRRPIIRFEFPGEWTDRETYRMARNHARHLEAEGISLA